MRRYRSDLTADLLLPALLCAAVAAGAAALVAALRAGFGLVVLPVPWVFCLFLAAESYLFTTFFSVRTLDAPPTVRWAEVAGAVLVAAFLAGLPVHGPVGALTGGVTGSTATMTLVYLICWFYGLKFALAADALHPDSEYWSPDGETVRTDAHGQAFAGISALLSGLVLGAAGLLSLLDWATGRAGFWSWSSASALVLLLTALAVTAVAVAAYLKRRISWTQQGLSVGPDVLLRWVPGALSLALLPLLAALLLPAGWARIPFERFVDGTRTPLDYLAPEQGEGGSSIPTGLRAYGEAMGEGASRFSWLTVLVWAGIGLLVCLFVWMAVAAVYGRLRDDLTGGGVTRFIRLLAAWLSALWQALREAMGGLPREVVRLSAKAAGDLFSETSLLGRLIPQGARRMPSDPRAAVRHCYRRLLEEAERRGWHRSAGATAAEFSRTLAGAVPGEAEAVKRITSLYEQARYDVQETAPESVHFVRRAWVAVARALGRRR